MAKWTTTARPACGHGASGLSSGSTSCCSAPAAATHAPAGRLRRSAEAGRDGDDGGEDDGRHDGQARGSSSARRSRRRLRRRLGACPGHPCRRLPPPDPTRTRRPSSAGSGDVASASVPAFASVPRPRPPRVAAPSTWRRRAARPPSAGRRWRPPGWPAPPREETRPRREGQRDPRGQRRQDQRREGERRDHAGRGPRAAGRRSGSRVSAAGLPRHRVYAGTSWPFIRNASASSTAPSCTVTP